MGSEVGGSGLKIQQILQERASWGKGENWPRRLGMSQAQAKSLLKLDQNRAIRHGIRLLLGKARSYSPSQVSRQLRLPGRPGSRAPGAGRSL